MRNVEKLNAVTIVMDTIVSNEEVSTASDFFGLPTALPVYAAPISGILQNYGAQMSDQHTRRPSLPAASQPVRWHLPETENRMRCFGNHARS